MTVKTTPQDYPRIDDEKDPFAGFLNNSLLEPHPKDNRIPSNELKQIIHDAIDLANKKSSAEILKIPEGVGKKKLMDIYRQEGKKLFRYFIRYCGDPASTAADCLGSHYTSVAGEQFRNRALQAQRMNSGWRYQFMAKDCAVRSKRFLTVSDIGATEADFNAVIKVYRSRHPRLNIYVSVKNRMNTMGGQDWPKAIYAIEEMAKADKNRSGPYICVFGIAMDRGTRLIRYEQKTGNPYSVNTEVWLSDYFWPFFSNYTYEEIMQMVLGVLHELKVTTQKKQFLDIPKEVIESFGQHCRDNRLVDEEGHFCDAERLVSLFCGSIRKGTRGKRSK